MKTMKKIVLFLFLLISFVNAYAALPINQIIFFGDSLSDNGNTYKLLLKFLPKSPPYFEGRFSNGPTWAEVFGEYYAKKSSVDYQIYAYGGATAIYHLPTTKFISPNILEWQINKYLIDTTLKDKSHTFFSIWIGANDYLYYYQDDADELTQKIIDKIAWSITTLIANGAEHFLIFNLPDLARTPFVKDDNMAMQLHAIILIHNLKLDIALGQIKSDHPNIKLTFINIYDLFNDIMDHPEKYNQKYNIHLTNTHKGCWTGGYWLTRKFSEKTLHDDIQQALVDENTSLGNVDIHAMSDFISHNPALLYAYAMRQSYLHGCEPCENPDEYLFWDYLHPTKVVHQILSQYAIEVLGDQIG